MKKLLLFLVLNTVQISPQNWFPTHIGDEWQYLTVFREFMLGEYTFSYGLLNLSITQDTVIENRTYFRWSKFPNLCMV